MTRSGRASEGRQRPLVDVLAAHHHVGDDAVYLEAAELLGVEAAADDFWLAEGVRREVALVTYAVERVPESEQVNDLGCAWEK